MNCLWITPVPSHPIRAGNRAYTRYLADSLRCEGFEVTYFLYGQEFPSAQDLVEMRSYWDDFIYLPHRIHKRRKSCGEVWGIDDWFNKDLELGVEFAIRQRDYDVVVVDYVFMSKAFEYVKGNTCKVLNTHDQMSNRHNVLESLGIPRDFFYTIVSEEKKALDRADVVLAIREDEAAFFRAQTKATVLTVSPGLSFSAKERVRRPFDDRLLTIGYMASKNSLNVRSLQMFIDILDKHPYLAYRVSIRLAGNICDGNIDYRSIQVDALGFIEDPNLFYDNLDIVINPMIGGTGLKIKTVEALASGCAVIATKEASMGIPTEAACLNHQNLGSIVESIDAVLNDPGLLDSWRKDANEAFNSYRVRAESEFRRFLRCLWTGGEDRICFVTDVPFWEPGVGSHTRILKFVNSLAEQASIDVFFLGSLWAERLAAFERAAPRVVIYSYKNYESSVNRHVRDTFPNLSGLTNHHHESWLNAFGLFLGTQKPYRLFVLEYIWLAYLSSAIEYPAIRAIDTHDVMSRRELEFAAYGETTNISITLAEEISILERFDVVIAIQKDEAVYLRRIMPQKIVITVPFSQEPANFTLPRQRVRVIGYVAANSSANVRSLKWFLANVWPKVRNLGICLHIIGSVCDSFSCLKEPNIFLKGKVGDLASAYTSCDLMINPVLFGGGLKIKTVEAMSFGRPIVTTEEGAAGFLKNAPYGLIKARTATEMAEALECLVKCRGLARSLGRSNHQYIQTEYSNAAATHEFIALWKVLIAGACNVNQ